MGYSKHVETKRGKKLKHGVFAQMDLYTKIAFIGIEVLWLIFGVSLLFTVGLSSLMAIILTLGFWFGIAIILFILVTRQNKEFEMDSVKVLVMKIKKQLYGKQIYRNINYKDDVSVKFMGANKVNEVFKKEAQYKQVRHERLRGSIKY